MSELNSQLVIARAARVEAEARLRQAQKAASGAGGDESLTQVLNSPLISALHQQEADLSRRLTDLSQNYGGRHPQVVSATAQLADVRAKIRSEVSKVIAGLSNELTIAQAREASLQGSFAGLRNDVSKQNDLSVQLNALMRDADANRNLLQTFLNRSKETDSSADFQAPDAQVISTADVPKVPSAPKYILFLAAAAVVSVLTAVSFAVLIEKSDDLLRSTDQIQPMLGAPALGLVPKIGGSLPPERFVVNTPVSAYSESLLSLHTALMMSDVDNPPKVVMFTSSVSGEGKTSTAAALARTLALHGHRILIIDCDLRRPALHEAFKARDIPGLTDLLLGNAYFDEAIHHDTESPAHVLMAGTRAPNPQKILGSTQLRSLLGDLKDRYDLIILDTPPVLAVSDARLLARAADKTVYLVRWASTRRKSAASGLKQILDTGATVAGVVLSVVDARKHSRYGFADSGLYHGQIKYYRAG
jgi:capsular exopolysaccharide synthesis family protein